ncbi:beta-galactosidase/beta-glucuronidase [Pedobacter sp. UYP30]|uniref:glycoside hydrolase family 2 protein n=1 Tax=Pedobacter sp. UYP30 TaxID=1756400 RepID=UPI00339458DF
MMKKTTHYAVAVVALSFAAFTAKAQENKDWQINKTHILTEWASKVNPASPLPEYPRPLLERGNWKNLNGLWEYAITAKDAPQPHKFDGKILVPFAVESALSGVAKTVGKDSTLWYKNTVTISSAMRKNNVLLHFGAVDWRTEVFVNGKKAGMHEGGFDPFTFNITPFLKGGSKQEVVVKVWDPTTDGPQPVGKQRVTPEGIWYTPVTGIWQTVWLEAVPKSYIESTKQTPDIGSKTLNFSADVVNAKPGDKIKVTAWDGDNKVAEQEVNPGEMASIAIPNQKLWSPDSPFLYGLKFSLISNGKVEDEAKSYFAMRKSALGKDANGIERMQLNNKFVFQYGPLDQGWWPDGLYTPPTYDAMNFDIIKLKEMGFNMIRKHIKVEPARYYYECDKLGMLLWQDMPSGDYGDHWANRPGVYEGPTDKNRTAESEGYYRKEWKAIMTALHNYPSIVVWTPFNEAWGQFKTIEITEWTKKMDPSRLVNSASGGNFFDTGDIVDLHNYPQPAMPRAEIFGKTKAVVLGEFGGLGLPVPDHTWKKDKNWGYQTFKTPEEMFKKYASFMDDMKGLIEKGLSAAVYTQTTDVENETNGFMTYDRKVIKMPIADLNRVNSALYKVEVK